MDFGLLAAIALLAVIVGHHFILARAVRDRGPVPRRLPRYPSLTVVRPIKGLDSGAELNIAAGLDNGYPGEIETLFIFDHPGEPAVPLVQSGIAAHRRSGGKGDARILFCGAPPRGMTGKLNAMMLGASSARG